MIDEEECRSKGADDISRYFPRRCSRNRASFVVATLLLLLGLTYIGGRIHLHYFWNPDFGAAERFFVGRFRSVVERLIEQAEPDSGQ